MAEGVAFRARNRRCLYRIPLLRRLPWSVRPDCTIAPVSGIPAAAYAGHPVQFPDGYILIRSKGSFGFTDIPKCSPYAIVTTVYRVSKRLCIIKRDVRCRLRHMIDVNQHAQAHHFLNGNNPAIGKGEFIFLSDSWIAWSG